MQLMLAPIAATASGKPMQKILSIVWLALGVGIVVNSITDMTEPHWQLNWLVLGGTASVMAFLCCAILYFNGPGRVVAMAIATVFILYCVYLFVLSVPVPIMGHWQGEK